MKNLQDIIQEKLQIGSKSKISQYKYHPKNKEELLDLLTKLLKERGKNADLNDIDTSKITDMSFLFTFDRRSFNGNISQWDVSNVTDMRWMFTDSSFNGDISQWDVSNVKNMEDIFDNCPLRKNPPKWYKD